MPRPAAKANGRRVTSPNRIVIAPAVRAVTAATAPKPSPSPATSAPPERLIGFRLTMYAIVTNVTPPPRTSAPTVDPRAALSNNRPHRPRGGAVGVSWKRALVLIAPPGGGRRRVAGG